MEPFEYIVVMSSLILSLGMAQIFNGVADMLANWNKVKFSYAHSILILIIFFVFIQDWFYSFFYAKQITDWTIPKIFSILIFPIILFIESRFLFPTGSRSQETDMEAYFYGNWRVIYSLFAVTIIISILQNIYYSGYTVIEQVPLFIYLGVYTIFIILNIKDKMLHKVFMTLQLVAWIFFIFFDDTIMK